MTKRKYICVICEPAVFCDTRAEAIEKGMRLMLVKRESETVVICEIVGEIRQEFVVAPVPGTGDED